MLDWIALGTSFLAVYLLGSKNRWGFLSFMVSNVLWISVGTMANSLGILVGNLAFFGMNARGFWKWKAPKAASSSPLYSGTY